MPTIIGFRKFAIDPFKHSTHTTTAASSHPPSQNMRAIGKRSKEESLLRMDQLQLKMIPQ
jgi:hypothetical protein